jgi:hypothetical protein
LIRTASVGIGGQPRLHPARHLHGRSSVRLAPRSATPSTGEIVQRVPHAPRPRPLTGIWAAAIVVRLSGGETVLSRVFHKFEPASPSHFPLGAVGLPRHRRSPGSTLAVEKRRRADLLLHAPPSRRPPGERSSPQLCSAPTPSPAGANPTGAPAHCPTAGRWWPRHRIGPVRGDRPAHAPSAPRRHGLAGPPWSWQPGPVPIRPSELSGPPAREHHRPWAECEAQRPF